MKNPFKQKTQVKTTPYTWDDPYMETRTVETPYFYKSDGKDRVQLNFDCRESWDICLNQWKRLGMPLPGDQITIRLCKESAKID